VENPYLTADYKSKLEALAKAEPVLNVEKQLNVLRSEAREKNQEDIMAKISVAYQAIDTLTKQVGELKDLVMTHASEPRLDRLIDHVNREVGVAQDVPLHERFAVLEVMCLKNFLKIKEATRLLN
jgi:hypothetical protein